MTLGTTHDFDAESSVMKSRKAPAADSKPPERTRARTRRTGARRSPQRLYYADPRLMMTTQSQSMIMRWDEETHPTDARSYTWKQAAVAFSLVTVLCITLPGTWTSENAANTHRRLTWWDECGALGLRKVVGTRDAFSEKKFEAAFARAKQEISLAEWLLGKIGWTSSVLSKEEVLAINLYTQNLFFWDLNKQLREDCICWWDTCLGKNNQATCRCKCKVCRKNGMYHEYLKIFVSGVAKCPAQNNTRIYRGIRADRKTMERYWNGNIVFERQVSSYTKQKSKSKEWSKGNEHNEEDDVRFVLTLCTKSSGSRAHDVAKYSNYQNKDYSEDEVILLPKTSVKVIGRLTDYADHCSRGCSSKKKTHTNRCGACGRKRKEIFYITLQEL